MFIELVQVAVGVRERLSRNPSDEEWERVFQMADEQAVVAFLFPVLERLQKTVDIHPPKTGISVHFSD